jgi:hypothetical protein
VSIEHRSQDLETRLSGSKIKIGARRAVFFDKKAMRFEDKARSESFA